MYITILTNHLQFTLALKTADQGSEVSLTPYYFGVAGLVIGALIFAAVWYLMLRRNRFPTYKILNSKLSEFCESYDVDKTTVVKLNPKFFPSDYLRLDTSDREQIVKNAKGKKLLIGFSKSYIEEADGNQNSFIEESVPQNYLPNNSKSDHQLLEKLDGIHRALSEKIDRMAGESKNTGEITELKNTIASLQRDKEALSGERNQLENNHYEKDQEIGTLRGQISDIRQTVVNVPYLSEYASQVLKLIQQINLSHQHALEALKLGPQQPSQMVMFMHLLVVKYSGRRSQEFDDWKYKLNQIEQNKFTTDKELIRSFQQIENESDRTAQFKKMLFKVLEKAISHILILTEEFKNISQFVPSYGSETQAIQQRFGESQQQLIKQAETIGINVKYVPLFVNYVNYADRIVAGNQPVSYPFNIVPKKTDQIVEILDYGVNTSYEQTETKILLSL